MKLVVAIIDTEYSGKVIDALSKNDYRATKLSSTGGFLKSGNTTILVGIEENQRDEVVDIIGKNSKAKKVKSEEKGEVEVGGATLFILDMNRYLRI